MGRRKNSTAAENTAQADAIASQAEQNAQRPHDTHQAEPIDAPASPEQGDGEPARRFIRHTFTSSAAGIRAGEDKRFNSPQVFSDFDDDKRATTEEKAELGQAGLRYRPSDKGYSALVAPETRQARDELSQK